MSASQGHAVSVITVAAAAATTPSTSDSTSAWPESDARVAPKTRRSAISRERLSAIAAARLAWLIAAMTRAPTTIAPIISTRELEPGGLRSPRPLELRWMSNKGRAESVSDIGSAPASPRWLSLLCRATSADNWVFSV